MIKRDFVYICKSLESRIKAQKKLIEKGYTWNGREEIDYNFLFKIFNCIAYFANSDKRITYYTGSFFDVYKYCKSKNVKIIFYGSTQTMETE